jgi:hypothetical protein
VILPKIGYRFDSVSVWMGAQYQRTRHTQPGTFTTTAFGPSISIPFNAEVEDAEQWSITKNWNLMAEGGVGAHRKQAMLGLTYRF